MSDEDIHMDGDDDQLAEGTANDAEDSFSPWLFRRLSPFLRKQKRSPRKEWSVAGLLGSPDRQ